MGVKSLRVWWTALATLSLVLAACGDVTKSDEYQAVVAERDAASEKLELGIEELAATTEELAGAMLSLQENQDELAHFTGLAEEFMAAALAAIGSPDDVECIVNELSLEGLFTVGILGENPDPAAVQSIDTTLLGEITAASFTCGLPGLFDDGPVTTSVYDLKVGDCFNEQPGPDLLHMVPKLDCSLPHDNEIYFEYLMSEEVWPGGESVLESSLERCESEFAGFVGVDYIDSELEVWSITPSPVSWDEGDRLIDCILHARQSSKLTGTMEGAKR